jgi:hypothetical protein
MTAESHRRGELILHTGFSDAWLRILKPLMSADRLGSAMGSVRKDEWDERNARTDLNTSAFHLRFQSFVRLRGFGQGSAGGGMWVIRKVCAFLKKR